MSIKRERGFSMLEVMVSLLVIMFGVLGMAGMQMLAVNNTELGRYQSLAAMMASTMEARMRVNSAYWGTPPPSITIDSTGINGGPTVYSGTCVGTVCSGVQMAYFDLANWQTMLTQAGGLPAGSATIACNQTVSPAACTITISWSEKNISLQNARGGETGQFANGTATRNQYQTLVTVI